MCRRVDCGQCGRPTYAGCGMHIEQVLGNVPAAERCRCREARVEDAGSRPPAERRSWLASLLRK